MSGEARGRWFGMVLALVVTAGSARAEWVAVSGEQVFNAETAEAEACRAAINKAKEEAVRKVTGERLSAEELMVCAEHDDQAECVLHRTTWSMVDGEVTALRNQHMSAGPTGIDGFRRCVVRLEANVTVANGAPDPSFDLGVKLSQSVFRPGEFLTIDLAPSQSMHVAAFQWLPYEGGDAQVSRIFPNPFETGTAIAGPTSIPGEDAKRRYNFRLTFPKETPASRRIVDEYLLVVATKRPVAFRETYRLEELKARLMEIPRSEVRLIKRGYSVVRGE